MSRDNTCLEGPVLPRCGEEAALYCGLNWGRNHDAWWAWARFALASHAEDCAGGSSSCQPTGECFADGRVVPVEVAP